MLSNGYIKLSARKMNQYKFKMIIRSIKAILSIKLKIIKTLMIVICIHLKDKYQGLDLVSAKLQVLQFI